MQENYPTLEYHPLSPFLPENARVLMLGSFPPKRERWSMDFFYPNFQNDMWRIMALLFFKDKNYFEEKGKRKFDQEKVIGFCEAKGIAIYDTAKTVRRLNDNASDKFLESVELTDIAALLEQLPYCECIMTTGQKATEDIMKTMECPLPKVGETIIIRFGEREIVLYRMPSSSRAYPLSIEKKSEFYASVFKYLGML